jgi:nitrile hydratase
MDDMPLAERLEKHRTLLAWLDYQAGLERRTVRDLEQQLAEETRRREKARQGQSFKIQPQRAGTVALLHRGDCGLFKGGLGLITAQEAIVALQDPEVPVEPCEICNPVAALHGVPAPPVEE